MLRKAKASSKVSEFGGKVIYRLVKEHSNRERLQLGWKLINVFVEQFAKFNGEKRVWEHKTIWLANRKIKAITKDNVGKGIWERNGEIAVIAKFDVGD